MSFQLEKCLKKTAQLRQDQAPLMSGPSLDPGLGLGRAALGQ